jgi:hypothetical protein
LGPIIILPLLTTLFTVGCADRSSTKGCFSVPQSVHLVDKPGFIKSPYAPDSGYIDVRGISPGTTVQCPYTGKPFKIE